MLHFLHPFYLFGVSLIIIPVILHLLGRRRIKEKPFSSLFLLKEIKKSSSLWMRIKELILLLLRVFILLFLFLAFSHPLVISHIPFWGSSPPKDVAILIDVSMSMADGNIFNTAKNTLLEIFKSVGEGQKVSVIAFSDRIEKKKEILNRAELDGFIKQLNVTFRGTNPMTAIEEAEKKLLAENGFLKELYIISDFQKNGFMNIESECSKLQDEKIDVYLSLLSGPKKNLFFTGWKMKPPFPLKGMKIRIFPYLAIADNGSYPVEFFLNNAMKGIKNITGKNRKVSFDFQTGSHHYISGYFHTTGDSLPLDNDYYFAFEVPTNLNVLLIGDKNKCPYLRTALNPGIKTFVRLRIANPSELPRIDVEQYDLIIIYNTKFDGIVKAKSMFFLSKGGGVLLIMGDKFADEVGNHLLNGTKIVKKMIAKNGYFSIKSVDTGFEPFTDFKNKGLSNLLDTKFSQYIKLQSNLRHIITLKNGDALMLYGNINGGRIVVCPFDFKLGWTQLPLKAIFVPFVYRMVLFLAQEKERFQEFSVGEPIRISLPKKLKNAIFVTPDGKRISALAVDMTEGINYNLIDTEIPGIYKFISQQNDTIPIAVNVKNDESKISPFSTDELKKLLPDIHFWESKEKTVPVQKKWLDLFPLFIVLTLLCLVAELILENK